MSFFSGQSYGTICFNSTTEYQRGGPYFFWYRKKEKRNQRKSYKISVLIASHGKEYKSSGFSYGMDFLKHQTACEIMLVLLTNRINVDIVYQLYK